MPRKLYDADGNEILAYTEDEVQTKEKELAEAKQKIADYDGKDLNFKRFKDLTEEEKSKLTAAQLAEKERADRLESEIESMKASANQSLIRSIIREKGLNEVDGKKVMDYLALIKDDEALGLNSSTEDGIRKKFEVAINAARPSFTTPAVNPIFGGSSGTGLGVANDQSSEDWTQSEAFKSMSNKLTGK